MQLLLNALIALVSSVLGPAVVAAIVSSIFLLVTSERRIAAENVIQERKNWRNKVRELADEVWSARTQPNRDLAILEQLHAKFWLILNPHEAMDQEILALIVAEQAAADAEFISRVALLLKHDWERAKREASLWRWILEREPRRVAFADFNPGIAHDYHNYRFRRWFVFVMGEMRPGG